MLALVILAGLLVADGPTPPPAEDPEVGVRREYESLRSAMGRSASEQIRLAYWCEAHGLPGERLQHLSRAVLLEPTNAEARGLLGFVEREGRWVRPAEVVAREASDPERAALLADYDQRRSTAPYTADGQFALGVWADDRGMKEQAKAHFTAVVRLDPGRDAAWRRLGYRKVEGRWQTEAQAAADRAEAEAQKLADKRWRPLLERWRGQLDRPNHQAEAEANLQSVTDPRAVPSVARVFGGEANHARAARLLGQIDSPAASRGLAGLAAFSPSAEARRIATETLRGRDAREYADLLIALIRDPIRYQVVPVAGPGSPGVLQIEGKQSNVRRIYAPPAPQILPGDRFFTDPDQGPLVERDLGVRSTGWFLPYYDQQLGAYLSDQYHARDSQVGADLTGLLKNQGLGDQSGRIASLLATAQKQSYYGNTDRLLLDLVGAVRPFNPGTLMNYDFHDRAVFSVAQIQQEALRGAAAARQHLEADQASLDRMNAEFNRTNDRVLGVLRAATGLNLPAEREPWLKWWVNLVGYRFNQASPDARPTLVEQVPLGDQPEVPPLAVTSQVVGIQRISCFGAGTLVQTTSGPRPIETLRIGDLVLTESTATGALHYQPILRVHHNPPGTTFRVRVGGEEIVSSDFHRFWVAARGWVMARNLQPGDLIRTLGGTLPVEAIAAGKVEPVFNLDVADDADFFAGRVAALVHDNTLPDTRLVPFDRLTGDSPR